MTPGAQCTLRDSHSTTSPSLLSLLPAPPFPRVLSLPRVPPTDGLAEPKTFLPHPRKCRLTGFHLCFSQSSGDFLCGKPKRLMDLTLNAASLREAWHTQLVLKAYSLTWTAAAGAWKQGLCFVICVEVRPVVRARLARKENAALCACVELSWRGTGLHFLAGSLSSPADGDLTMPEPKWRVRQGVGTASGQESRKRKKSFLLTYFPKLPLAPVPLAWTVPLPGPRHPAPSSGLAQCHPSATSLLRKRFWAAGSDLTEWGAGSLGPGISGV